MGPNAAQRIHTTGEDGATACRVNIQYRDKVENLLSSGGSHPADEGLV